MARLSDVKIKEIQEQYKILGVYSQVAKIVGCSPATVKKYALAEDIGEVKAREATRYATYAQIKEYIKKVKSKKVLIPSVEEICKHIQNGDLTWNTFTEKEQLESERRLNGDFLSK